jgi:hypothetical protein
MVAFAAVLGRDAVHSCEDWGSWRYAIYLLERSLRGEVDRDVLGLQILFDTF